MLACYMDLIQTRQRGEMYVCYIVSQYRACHCEGMGLATVRLSEDHCVSLRHRKGHALPDLSREVVLPKRTESCGHLDTMVCMEKSP